MKTAGSPETKKQAILELARSLGVQRFTPAEIAQIRRQLIVRLGPSGKTEGEYITEVLKDAGMRVAWAAETETEDLYEEEFHDLLHFATLEEAEMCLVRLDELWRKFRTEKQAAAGNRVLDIARLGRRRAEMIARNPRVDAAKRAEKQEIVQWFRVWLETPDAFFDWLELRKLSPEYLRIFQASGPATEE